MALANENESVMWRKIMAAHQWHLAKIMAAATSMKENEASKSNIEIMALISHQRRRNNNG
jgi:hypothetical protein